MFHVSNVEHLIRDPAARAKHRARARLIRELKRRTEVMIGVQILLSLVSQPGSNIEFWVRAPVGLKERSKLQLVYIDDRIPGRLPERNRVSHQIIREARKGKYAKIVGLRRTVVPVFIEVRAYLQIHRRPDRPPNRISKVVESSSPPSAILSASAVE